MYLRAAVSHNGSQGLHKPLQLLQRGCQFGETTTYFLGQKGNQYPPLSFPYFYMLVNQGPLRQS